MTKICYFEGLPAECYPIRYYILDKRVILRVIAKVRGV
jgi:hypothetical protein